MAEKPGLFRLAVDIGGTFTDVVLEGPNGSATAKVLTTPAAPEKGVLNGVEDVLAETGADAGDVSVVLHGTTLATNAIIERKGAKVALITTEGFRDVLEIGYETRFNQYDVFIDKPEALVPRKRRLTVPERVDVSGKVLKPLDEAAVVDLLPELDEMEVDSVTVGFLHSYANPDHERRVRDILNEHRPGLSVSLSSEVCPEIREYERLTTATANAYVRPLMARYLENLESRLKALGAACPILLMTSGGGLTDLKTARMLPIRLVESGPAGGAILATRIAAELGLRKVISFDMGGTTAKICLIDDFQAQKAREFEVDRQARFRKGSGLPLRIPVIEMVEIGAGGGSIARVDAMQRITIGPDSAGSDPGPAAYGQGGERPTITDADIHLGRIDPQRFAAGKVPLAPDRAEAAINNDVAGPLGLRSHMAPSGLWRWSMKPWPMQPVFMRSNRAARPVTTPLSRSAAPRRCMPGASPKSSRSAGSSCRRMRVSARRSVSCARPSLTKWSVAAICVSGISMLRWSMRFFAICTAKPLRSCGPAHRVQG